MVPYDKSYASVIGTEKNPLQNIMRNLKRHTSEVLHKSIQKADHSANEFALAPGGFKNFLLT